MQTPHCRLLTSIAITLGGRPFQFALNQNSTNGCIAGNVHLLTITQICLILFTHARCATHSSYLNFTSSLHPGRSSHCARATLRGVYLPPVAGVNVGGAVVTTAAVGEGVEGMSEVEEVVVVVVSGEVDCTSAVNEF